MIRAISLASTAAASALVAPPAALPPALAGVRGDYVLHCGGCHGLQGDSGGAAVPQLRGRVGRLLCTADGRRYALRLPNVAMVRGLDEARVARLMTFVMNDLGGATGFPPYRPGEVARGRAAPLVVGNLRVERARIWRAVDLACGRAPIVPKLAQGRSKRRPD